MADHILSKLNPETHLILDQPLLRLPYESLRKNFKMAQLSFERDSMAIRNSLKETANASLSNSSTPDEVLRNLDSMIIRMRALVLKITGFGVMESGILMDSTIRLRHVAELFSMQSLDDVKYEAWSRTRLDRLLVDYLLRSGYEKSAIALATAKGILPLVDVEIFAQMSRIRESIRDGKVHSALAWCTENKKELRRMGSKLEFTLRLQQYIELVRTKDEPKLHDAITHGKKYLLPFKDTYPKEVQQAWGLLAYRPGAGPSKYEDLYSPSRWEDIAKLFVETHNSLLSLPPVPLLYIALSAGLSALKTPSCHSSRISSSSPSSASSITSVCPICSSELNDLARNVPYAHHTKSHVDPDPVLLPNNRVYGKSKLEECSRKAGLDDKKVLKDLITGEVFPANLNKKIFIS